MYLHLHGQSRWHDDITIIGNREALTRLRYLIDTVLKQEAVNGISSASSETTRDDACFFTNDGEGYFADVVLLEDSDERWKALKLPYTDLEIIRPKDDDLVWNARKQDFESDHRVVAHLTKSSNGGFYAADGDLISAAPDLLEALKNIMDGVAGCEREPKWEAARAAIAKATGVKS